MSATNYRVEGFENLLRDAKSKAITSRDTAGLRKRMAEKKIHEQMSEHSDRLSSVESSIDEIKRGLNILLQRNGVMS